MLENTDIKKKKDKGNGRDGNLTSAALCNWCLTVYGKKKQGSEFQAGIWDLTPQKERKMLLKMCC